MSNLLGVVVAHGDVARALVEAAQAITGQREGLIPVTNEGCTRETLRERINDAANAHPAVVFVDMPVGSCVQAALRSVQRDSSRAVVAGVNLAMLVDFCFHRDATPQAAADRAVQQGVAAVKPVS